MRIIAVSGQFDPFGDFATAGYLRNSQREKDPAVIKVLEHQIYRTMLPKALNFLAGLRRIEYADFLQVHRILFEDLYPWAGQDRMQTMPDRAVVKGEVRFCDPLECERAVLHGLELAQDKGLMVSQPGLVMGLFAYGHPFLDGNGRTMLLVHAELCSRAGMSIDWHKTNKNSYLTALTREIADPNGNHLDAYLQPFIGPPIPRAQWLQAASDLRGLEGGAGPANEYAPRYTDPGVMAQQKEFERLRGYDLDMGF
ncbi:Fic family protein [Castellaniella sp.]|uniref:Fic family protein n=1 Tax=Castellaniella sp. TaxID=1955812 RepID=UPI002B0021F5|nr:Fic family protein [Castellaniella sp.]